MPGGRCERIEELPAPAREIVEGARRATLSTLDELGYPHSVPVCFAVDGAHLVSAIDHKPKRGRPARLANIERRPHATMLFDRWDEDWSRLGWVMVRGDARVRPPGETPPALVARYPQYGLRPPEGETIVVDPVRITWWTCE